MSAIEKLDGPSQAITLYRKPEVEVYVGTHFREATWTFYESTEVTREAFYEMLREAWLVLRNKRIAAGRKVACALETALHAIITGSTATAHFTYASAKTVHAKALVPGSKLSQKGLTTYGTSWKEGFPVLADQMVRPLNWVGNAREIKEAEGRVERAIERRTNAMNVFRAAINNEKCNEDKRNDAELLVGRRELHEQQTIKSRHEAYRKRNKRALVVSVGGAITIGASAFLAHQLSLVADTGLFASASLTVPFALGKYGKRIGSDIPLPTVDRTQMRRDEPIDKPFVIEAFSKLPNSGFQSENIEPLSPIKEAADGNGWSMALELPGVMTIGKLKEYHVQLEKLLKAPVGGLEIIGDPVRGSGFVIIRVSDLHASQRKATAWPLLDIDRLNFFEPLPIGVEPMGEIGTISIAGKNVFGAGISDTGKSESQEKLAFAALMDPIVEARFVCGKNIDEFGLLADAGTVSIKGDPTENDHVARDFYQLLETLRSEITKRGNILDARGLGEKKVTEELARSVSGLHPIVVFIDEYHKFKNHHELGTQIQSLMMDIVTQCRFVMIHLIPFVQSIHGQGIPTPFVTQFQKKIGFRMGISDVTAINDGRSHANGMDPSAISEDLPGTAIISGSQPTTVRFFHPSQAEKVQVARKIIDMRGGPVQKLDLTPKVELETVDEPKRRKSSKFPELLDDILAMQTEDHLGRIQCREMLPSIDDIKEGAVPLLDRPEYEGLDYNSLAAELRIITSNGKKNLVDQINKESQGGRNAQGVRKSEIQAFINGRG